MLLPAPPVMLMLRIFRMMSVHHPTYVFMDTGILISVFDELAKCLRCNSSVKTTQLVESKQGLYHTFKTTQLVESKQGLRHTFKITQLVESKQGLRHTFKITHLVESKQGLRHTNDL